MNNNSGGIALDKIDGVITAFKAYRDNINNVLTKAKEQDYSKAYKGFEVEIKSYVDNVCDSVKNDIVARLDATIDALSNAKQAYSSKKESVLTDIRSQNQKFTFQSKAQ